MAPGVVEVVEPVVMEPELEAPGVMALLPDVELELDRWRLLLAVPLLVVVLVDVPVLVIEPAVDGVCTLPEPPALTAVPPGPGAPRLESVVAPPFTDCGPPLPPAGPGMVPPTAPPVTGPVAPPTPVGACAKLEPAIARVATAVKESKVFLIGTSQSESDRRKAVRSFA
jgi:hypothetical protein